MLYATADTISMRDLVSVLVLCSDSQQSPEYKTTLLRKATVFKEQNQVYDTAHKNATAIVPNIKLG